MGFAKPKPRHNRPLVRRRYYNHSIRYINDMNKTAPQEWNYLPSFARLGPRPSSSTVIARPFRPLWTSPPLRRMNHEPCKTNAAQWYGRLMSLYCLSVVLL